MKKMKSKITTKSVLAFALLSGLFMADCTCGSDQAFKNVFSPPTSDAFAVLVTANMQGYVQPCGCTAAPLGGIDRLVAFVGAAFNHFGGRAFYVDGGNLLFDSTEPKNKGDMCQEQARLDLLLDSLIRMDVLGTFPSSFDDAQGVEFRNAQLAKWDIADLREQAKVFNAKGAHLGILYWDQKPETAVELDAKAQKLRAQGARAVVVFAQATLQTSSTQLASLAHVDVVVATKDPSESPPLPYKEQENGPVFVSFGKQGQYVGLMEFFPMDRATGGFELDDAKVRKEKRLELMNERKKGLKEQIDNAQEGERKAFLEGRLKLVVDEINSLNEQKSEPRVNPYMRIQAVAIKKSFPSDTPASIDLAGYEKAIPRLTKACEQNLECPIQKKTDPSYVGDQSCRTCHQAAYDFWQKALVKAPDEQGQVRLMGHAKAWQTLQEKNKTADRTCIGCHSIGFMQPGGYCKASEVEFRVNVQCEACHGPGGFHAQSTDKNQISRKVPESVCRGCHHVPHIESTESFVYEEKLKLILGPGHGRPASAAVPTPTTEAPHQGTQ